MGRPVMLTLEDKDIKGFTWAIAPALTSLGYLLILLVAIFPFWVRLVNEESREVFFSGLFENCFHIKCWRPRPLSSNVLSPAYHIANETLETMFYKELGKAMIVSAWKKKGSSALALLTFGVGQSLLGAPSFLAVYIILGRVFLLSAVVLSFLTTLIMVSFASQLFPRTRKHNFVSAFFSFLTGACALLALLLHALEIQSLTMKPSPPQFSVQWPYYILGFGIFLFIVAGAICLFQETACLRCHLLPISKNIEETEEIPHLENPESLGGGLSSIQKETLLKEQTVI